LYTGSMVSRQRDLLYNKSRMMREYHVRFRERFRGATPLYLLDVCPEQASYQRDLML
jgi:hypothetical protein